MEMGRWQDLLSALDEGPMDLGLTQEGNPSGQPELAPLRRELAVELERVEQTEEELEDAWRVVGCRCQQKSQRDREKTKLALLSSHDHQSVPGEHDVHLMILWRRHHPNGGLLAWTTVATGGGSKCF